jgi:acyl-lipid omega-6 desaturase (Delta-12 desaturase)
VRACSPARLIALLTLVGISRSVREYSPEFRHKVYQHISKYAKAEWGPALFHATTTILAFVGVLWAMTAVPRLPESLQFVASTALVLLLSGVTLRVFMIFHDCAHRNFFPTHTANYLYCMITTGAVLTPYTGWQRGHDYHHRVSNNDSKKQYSQTAPWSMSTYQAAPTWQKIAYALIYGKYTLITTTPVVYFWVGQRFMSTVVENCILVAYWFAIYKFGIFKLVAIAMCVSCVCGLYLFHVQHTFDGSYHAPNDKYDTFINGMEGSSLLVVPKWLRYFTNRIEYHHIHHLNAHVPSYRLKECHEAAGDLFKTVPRLTMRDAFNTVTHSLRSDLPSRKFVNVYEELPGIPFWVPDLLSALVVVLFLGVASVLTQRPWLLSAAGVFAVAQILSTIRCLFIDREEPNKDEHGGISKSHLASKLKKAKVH